MSWHNIIFTLFSYIFKSMGAYRVLPGRLVADDALTLTWFSAKCWWEIFTLLLKFTEPRVKKNF